MSATVAAFSPTERKLLDEATERNDRQPHQLLRVDRETREPIPAEVEARLIEHIRQQLPECDAVLISDYAKGACTPSLLRVAIEAAPAAGKPVLIDPSRDVNYGRYAGATLVAPNRLAAELLSSQRLCNEVGILSVAEQLRETLQLDAAVITLDRDGMALAAADAEEILSCRPRAVCDVTGAGDMVLSVLGLCTAAGVSIRESLRLANAAAGLEVERFGVEPLSRAEISAELAAGDGSAIKITTLEALLPRVERQRRTGKQIAFTNGCFDLLHVGHVTLLQEAARLGDLLIVAINSDATVRRLKGPERPVIGALDRARMLAALDCVDFVIVFDDETPCRLLEALRPEVLVKGGTTGRIVGREIVEVYGRRVLRADEVPGRATSSLVERIRCSDRHSSRQ